MEIIDEAYSILRDPEKRTTYDLQITAFGSKNFQLEELKESEKIINLWQMAYTTEEQGYIEKIRTFNRTIKSVIAIGAVIFLRSVVTFHFYVSFSIIFILVFMRQIIWSVYKIKNPPPPIEIWAVK